MSTLSLLVLESWDGYGGDRPSAGRMWQANPFMDTAHPKTGARSLGGGAPGESYGQGFTQVTSYYHFGCWVYFTGSPPNSNDLFLFTSGATFDGFNATVTISLLSDGSLRIRYEGGILETSATSVVATNAFSYIEGKFYRNSSGSWTVKVNGTTVLNGTGNTGTSASAGVTTGTNNNYWMDDFWVLNSNDGAEPFFGDLIVSQFVPTGDGANTGLTVSTGSSHYPQVDEATPNDDTDYNGGGASVKDTYTFTTSSLAGFTIYGVKVAMCVKATTGGTNTAAAVTRIGGTDYDGSTLTVPTAYDYISQHWAYRPSDSAAWSQSDISEFGMKSIASAVANRLTQIFIEVLSSTSIANLTVNVSDAVSVSESVSKQLHALRQVTVSDSVTVSESVTKALRATITAEASETISVDENLLLPFRLLLIERITVRDQTPIVHVSKLTIHATDYITVRDRTSGPPHSTVGLQDYWMYGI